MTVRQYVQRLCVLRYTGYEVHIAFTEMRSDR
jgi:hypothetical protein